MNLPSIKERLILMVMVVFTAEGFCQSYRPMVVEGAHWIVSRDWVDTPWLDDVGSFTIKGDSIFNGITYQKMYYEPFRFNDEDKTYSREIISSRLYVFVREDTLEKKVFVVRIHSDWEDCLENEEYLHFDYSLGVGDTINDCSIPLEGVGHIPVVDSIGFVTTSFFDFPLRAIYTTILRAEGIGGTATKQPTILLEKLGFVHAGFFLEGIKLLEYCVGDYAACNITTSLSTPPKSSIQVFPNPAGDFLNIEFSKNKPDPYGEYHVEVFNTTGQQLLGEKMRFPSTQLKVNLLQSGIYLLVIRLPGNQVLRLLFGKQ